MKDRINYLIGIDAGGTKTTIVLTDENCTIIEEVNSYPCQFSELGLERFVERVSGEIKYMLIKTGNLITECGGICVSAAGLRYASDKKAVEKLLKKKLGFNRITAESDAIGALYAAFEGKDGATIISGTGSIVYAKHKTEIIRAGGWGKIIDDGGSGYSIGVKAFKHICKQYDLNNNTDYLVKKIKSNFGIDENNILTRIYQDGFPIQKLAEIVIKAAGKGNIISKKILIDSASDIIELLETILMRIKPVKKLPLSFAGGLIQNKNYYSNLLEQNIKKRFRNRFEIIKTNTIPAKGAVYLAKIKFLDKKK